MTVDRKKLGKRNRSKGLQFERDVANVLKELYPEARRHLENHKSDAALGIDLINTGALRIQCKRHSANYSPIKKIEQVKVTDGIPVLITKCDNKKPMVALSLEDFVKILKDVGEAYKI